jgi:hypothetical protein
MPTRRRCRLPDLSRSIAIERNDLPPDAVLLESTKLAKSLAFANLGNGGMAMIFIVG